MAALGGRSNSGWLNLQERQHKPSPVAIAFSLWLALFLCCAVVAVVAYSSGRQTEFKSIRSDESGSGRFDKVQADTDHAGVPAFAERFLSNREPASEDERNSRDLAAQENSAAWAFWLVALAVLQVFVSGAGLWALVFTIQQGRHGLAEAARANFIASRVQRAWLSLRLEPQLVRRHENGLFYRLSLITENVGQTPATHVGLTAFIAFHKMDADQRSLAQQFREQILAARSIHMVPREKILAPNECEIAMHWDSKFPPDFVDDVVLGRIPAVNMLVAVAVYYRTTTDPDILQTSWRIWQIGSRQESREPLSFIDTSSSKFKDDLHVMPVVGMMHWEGPQF